MTVPQPDFDIAKRIDMATTHVVKVVFPNTTNNFDTLFGGTALQWMDEVAFITATRFSRKKMVTVSTNKIDFKEPIPEHTFVELIGRIARVGKSSVDVSIEIYKEEMYSAQRVLAISGLFTMVAIGADKKPTQVLSSTQIAQ